MLRFFGYIYRKLLQLKIITLQTMTHQNDETTPHKTKLNVTKPDETQKVIAKREKGAPPGRHSIMWDIITDISLAPLVGSVGIMQGALPAVSAGVEKTGAYKYDTANRAKGSAASLARFLFDGGNKAYQEASELRKMHANIKGTLENGQPYFALNPITYRIVPDTLLDAVIRIREMLKKSLNDQEKETLYEEYTQLCLMLGIPRKYIPKTLEDFYHTYINTIETELTITPAVSVLLGDKIDKERDEGAGKESSSSSNHMTNKNKNSNNIRPISRRLFIIFYNKFIDPTINLCTRGALHPRYRELNNIQWSKDDQVRFDKIVSRTILAHRIIPRAFRYGPMALMLLLGLHGPKLITAEEVKIREEKNAERQARKKTRESS